MVLRSLAVAVTLALSACAGSSHRSSEVPASSAALSRSGGAPANAVAAPGSAAILVSDPFAYRLLTPADTHLARVYDDGKCTFVQFAGALPPAGLMLFDENGKALAYTVSGNTVTIAGVHRGVLVRTPTHSSYAQASRPLGTGVAQGVAAPSPAIAAARAQVLEAQGRLTGLAAQVQQASRSGDATGLERIRQELDELDTQMAGIDATLVRARFAEGQSQLVLSDGSKRALLAAAQRADRIVVRAGVDAGPTERSGAKLALARAVAARRLLVEGGVPAGKVRAMYFTKVFVAPNTTPEGRAVNRRVDFVLVGAHQQRVKLDVGRVTPGGEFVATDLAISPRPLRPVGRPASMRTFRGLAGS